MIVATVIIVVHLGVQYWISRGFVEIDSAQRDFAEFRADLNSADWPELANLPGYGETLARRIVEYRERNGPFRSIQELEHVRGIGPGKLARIRIYLLPIETHDGTEKPAVDPTVKSDSVPRRETSPDAVSARPAADEENRR